MQLSSYLLLLLPPLTFLNGLNTPGKPDVRLQACFSATGKGTQKYVCKCHETVVNCTKTTPLLEVVPEEILARTKQLYLNGNAINRLEDYSFGNYEFLEELFLQDNKISFIHRGAFNGLYKLQILNLNNNRIGALDTTGQTFQHLPALRELHLQKNQITKINKYSFLTIVGPSKTVTVYLKSNAVQCNCDVHALMSWVQSQTVGKVEIKDLTCGTTLYAEYDHTIPTECTYKSWSDDSRKHQDNTITVSNSHDRHSVEQASSLDANIDNHNKEITIEVKTRLPNDGKFKSTNVNQASKKENIPNQALKNGYSDFEKRVHSNSRVQHNVISLITKGQSIKYGNRKHETVILKTYKVSSGAKIQKENSFGPERSQRETYLNVTTTGSENWYQTSNAQIKYIKYELQDIIKNNFYRDPDKIMQKIKGQEVNKDYKNIINKSKIRQINKRETSKKVIKRQIAQSNPESASENNLREMSTNGNNKHGETESDASQNKVFGSVITCPTCEDENTNHACNLKGARQCFGEQVACHKILQWHSHLSTMTVTSKCDNYTSCMAEEANNQQECGIGFNQKDTKVCHFCCYGPTCTAGSLGGSTKDLTFDLSYIRDEAQYEPYMADSSHPRYLQEEQRIVKGIRLAITGLKAGLDVNLVRFVPQQNGLYQVVVRIYVTTFSLVPEEDIKGKITFSITEAGSFFNGENINPDSLNLLVAYQDSRPCPEETTNSADMGDITWHASPEGKVFMLCPYRDLQTSVHSSAVRSCLRTADGSLAWGDVDYSSCSSRHDLEPITLDTLFNATVTTGNAKVVSAMLKTYMEAVENLTAKTVRDVVNKLEMLLQEEMLQQPEVVNNVVGCLSNFISSDQKLDAFKQRINISQRLLSVIDHISEKTPLVNGTLVVVTPNLAILAQGVNSSETLDVALTVDADSTDGLLNNSKITVGLSSGNRSQLPGSSSIIIPTQALIASMTPEEQRNLSRISFVVHQTDTLFAAVNNNKSNGGLQPNETENDLCQHTNSLGCQRESTHKFITKINSQVISASILDVTVAGLKENITMNFIHDTNATNPRCVFWNISSSNGSGEWSGKGCGVVKSDSGETTCGCNHLTNFALIMDVYQEGSSLSEMDRKILSIISYVGCGISLVALILTLLTYSCFRSWRQTTASSEGKNSSKIVTELKLRRDNPSKILINLCLALMLSNLVFLVGMHDYTFENTASCKVVAILLHYFLLSSLTWMAIEAFYMYLALFLVFKTYFTKFLLKCCLVGWGVPLGIVFITLSINSTDNYGIINSGLCWLRNPAFYAAFIGPVCIILLVNCLAFGLVIRQLFCFSSANLSKTDRNSTVQRLRGAIGVVFLLGLSWLFAIFAIGQASVAFYYLFAVFNSMQGLFIFIFYCVLKKDAVMSWKRLLPCFEEYGETSKTSSNSRVLTAAAATHHMAKHDTHSRSESSTFLGNTASVTSTFIDSRKNSCLSNGSNNNPYDSSEEYDTPLKIETAAPATEFKQRLSPLSSERKYNPESKSQDLSSYSSLEINSQSQESENAGEVPYIGKAYITSKNLDSNLSQLQPVLASNADCNIATSSQCLHLQRSANVAVDSSDVVREDSIQLELPDNGWSYSWHKDNKNSLATSLSRSEGEIDCSSDSGVAENRSESKQSDKETDISLTPL